MRTPHAGPDDQDDARDAQAVADHLPDMVCRCRDGVIIAINPAGLRMLGLEDAATVLGRPFADLVHGDYAAVVEDGLDDLCESGAVPLMFDHASGGTIEVEARASRLPAGTIMLHVRDLTERMRAVKDVLESETRYRALVDLALDFICLVSGDVITMINAAGRSLLGVGDDALVGQPLEVIVHPDYQAIVGLGLDVLAAENDLMPLKFRGGDGAGIDVEVRVMPLGRGDAYMIEARDIRDRLRSAEAVRERQARLQGILDTVAEGIVTADEHGVIMSFNRAAERIFGFSPKEAVGQNLAILMPARDAAAHAGFMTAYLGGAGGAVLGRGRELMAKRKDGSLFPIELNISELRQGKTRLLTGIIRDITDRKRAEESERRYKQDLQATVEERTRELRVLSHQTQGILDSAGDGIVGLDLDGVITFANPAAHQTLGWEPGALLGRAAQDVFRYGSALRHGRGVPVRAALRRGLFFDRVEVDLLRRDGVAFPAEYASSPIEDDGARSGAVVVFRDISERRAAEERLSVAAAVFDTTAEGILVSSPEGVVSMANPASQAISGWDDPVGRTVSEVLFPLDPFAWESLIDGLRHAGHWVHEAWSERRDGGEWAMRLAASALTGEDGAVRRVVLVVNDITQRKRDEERIRFQANYDMLTGLPNRTLFNDRLAQAVAGARRSHDRVGLMFIDLDGFKAINDTFGHEAGDLLLKGAAGRLRKCVRESDTVARLGGDEFTVIMAGLDGAEGAAVVAGRIIDSLTIPFDLPGQDGASRLGRVSASIGIALLPDHGHTAEDLLRNADAAMYHAKEQGKANYQFFRGSLATA